MINKVCFSPYHDHILVAINGCGVQVYDICKSQMYFKQLSTDDCLLSNVAMGKDFYLAALQKKLYFSTLKNDHSYQLPIPFENVNCISIFNEKILVCSGNQLFAVYFKTKNLHVLKNLPENVYDIIQMDECQYLTKHVNLIHLWTRYQDEPLKTFYLPFSSTIGKIKLHPNNESFSCQHGYHHIFNFDFSFPTRYNLLVWEKEERIQCFVAMNDRRICYAFKDTLKLDKEEKYVNGHILELEFSLENIIKVYSSN